MVKKFTETINTWGFSQDIRNTNLSRLIQLANSSSRNDILSKTIFSFPCCLPSRWQHAPIPQLHDMFDDRRRLAPNSKSVIQDIMTDFFQTSVAHFLEQIWQAFDSCLQINLVYFGQIVWCGRPKTGNLDSLDHTMYQTQIHRTPCCIVNNHCR